MITRLKKNMKGLAQAQLAVLVVIVIAVVGVVAWKVLGNGSSVSVNKEIQSKCQTVVKDDIFCKFAGAFGNVGDYKTTVSSTVEGSVTTLELANDSKDNSSMVVKQNGQEQASVIVFSGVTYSKDYTDNKWFKYGSGDTGRPESLDLKKEFLKSDYKGDNGQALQYKKIGTEKCDKLTCYKYQVVDPAKTTETSYLFFDTKSYLLRRATVTDSSNKTNADMTVTYETVTITAPSPTKDLPTVTE